MPLQTNLANFVTRVATEFKTIHTRMGSLTALTTTQKGSLVEAINEVQSAAANATGINDSATATTTTWSSTKINTQINAAVPTWSTLSGKPDTFPPTIGTTASTAKAGNYVPTWAEITGKPATFAPIIGTTATTAKAGNYVPSWAEVSGKPTFAAVATSGNYADLTGTIPTAALPPLAITSVTPVASQTAMLALAAQEGDVAIRTDTSQTFILAAEPASTLANWKLIETPVGVTSVAGRTGAVTLTKADVGLSNVDNTSDAAKPVSTATQTALNGKANTSHTHTSANITDTTTTGRAVMTASSAAAARTALGAGTSNLVIGDVAGTAQDSAAVGDTEVNLVAIFEAALV